MKSRDKSLYYYKKILEMPELDGEVTVGMVADYLDCSQSYASYLLRAMVDGRLLHQRNEDNHCIYMLNPRPKSMAWPAPPDNGIPLGQYYPPKPITSFAELVKRHA